MEETGRKLIIKGGVMEEVNQTEEKPQRKRREKEERGMKEEL